MNPDQHLQNVAVRLIQDNRFQVSMGDQVQIGDTYYLGIAAADDEHPFDAAEGLRILLRSWIRELELAQPQQITYLPFDFSDEFTRWIACQQSDQNLLVVFGSAAVEGWAISPRDFSNYAHRLPEFQPDSPVVIHTFYRPFLLSRLRQALANVIPPAAEPL